MMRVPLQKALLGGTANVVSQKLGLTYEKLVRNVIRKPPEKTHTLFYGLL